MIIRVHYDSGEFVRTGKRRGGRILVIRGEVGVVDRRKVRIRHGERSTVSNTSRVLEVVVVLSGSCSDLYRGCLEVSSLSFVNRSNACKGRGVSKFVALFVLCQNVAIVREGVFRFP